MQSDHQKVGLMLTQKVDNRLDLPSTFDQVTVRFDTVTEANERTLSFKFS
jgi:hypothetical protein